LKLPGEIRNEIYAYAIYSKLGSINIAQGLKQRHVRQTVLDLGIFRTSHQIRVEALSYLCATKHLEICGSKAAISFFECVGDVIGEVKRITIAQPIVHDTPSEQIDKLFHFLDKATSLQYLKLEVGKVGGPYHWDMVILRDDRVLLEKMLEFVKKKEGLEFHWAAGSYDPRAMSNTNFAMRTTGVRTLMGQEKEDLAAEGLVRMW
jgi:hypothetical protein